MSKNRKKHDFNNPDPWEALAVDNTGFIDQNAKDALMRNNGLKARQFLLPIIRPLARIFIIVVQLIRLVLPNSLTSAKFLHKTITWGIRYFVHKDATYLIIRHFNIGSQILTFLNQNIAKGDLKAHPLYPLTIDDLGNNTFIQHDLNIYNFITQMGNYLTENNQEITAIDLKKIDFSAIKDFDSKIEDLPDTWHNILDLQSAIEFYTPLFAIFLSDDDFWRASNSLQLDEIMAVYVARIFDQPVIVGMVNNKHPMVPLSTLEAGFRLMLHGMDAENLYGFIHYMKEQSKK